jgi:hypothetical protein
MVNTHGKWLIAWDQAVEATTYIFPHCALELREYGKHITQLFASFPDHLHTRIIQYDRAVRIRAAQRRNLLLTDYAQFGDLHVLWIQNAGGAAGGARDDSKQTKGSGSALIQEGVVNHVAGGTRGGAPTRFPAATLPMSV